MQNASVQGTAAKWMREKDAVLAQLEGLWQCEKLDQDLRSERLSTIAEFSRSSYAQWATSYFLRSQEKDWSQDFANFLFTQDERYLLQKDENGEYRKDAAGKYILKGLDNLASDAQNFEMEALEKRRALLREFDQLEGDLLRFGAEVDMDREQVAAKLREEWQNVRGQLGQIRFYISRIIRPKRQTSKPR